MFTVLQQDTRTRARVGVLKTKHGVLHTPAYAIVGTHAEVRCLSPEDMVASDIQLVIANTFHLWHLLGEEGLRNFEGLHERMKLRGVVMTDSGGFQVFSLGFGRQHGIGKLANIFPRESVTRNSFSERGMFGNFFSWFQDVFGQRRSGENLVRITKNGAWFSYEGKRGFLGPELSIAIQEKLSPDIMFAFDECTSPLHGFRYTKRALKRTHRWALRSLKARTKEDILLYGIVQGGAFEKLRKESARFIGGLPFDGFGIGGSLGTSKEEMHRVLDWTIPFLPETKPRHLLGIGKVEDVFEAVARGIDTFDCVIPTREARRGGSLWTAEGRIHIRKSVYRDDSSPVEEGCECPVCGLWRVRRAELHRLYRAKDPRAARLGTIHNVFFFNRFMEKIRRSIMEGRFLEFKESFLLRFKTAR